MQKFRYSLTKPRYTLAVTSSLHHTSSTAFHNSLISWYVSKQELLFRAPLHPMGVRCSRVRQWSYSKSSQAVWEQPERDAAKNFFLFQSGPVLCYPSTVLGHMAVRWPFLAAAGLEIVSTKIRIQVEKRSRTVIKMVLFLNLVYYYPSCLETSAIHHWWLEAFS